MDDTFTIRSSALPTSARLAGFRGSEGMSRLYRFDVFVVMTDDTGQEVDLKAAAGAKATLRHEGKDGVGSFTLSGVFASIQLVSDFAGRSVFHAVLVPRFWYLTQSLHSRLFTQQSLPEILTTVLAQGGMAGAYSLQLLGSYATEEHVCQYKESDFDFVSRWMEREGLYYYFEQDEDEERLIITDDLSTHHVLGSPVRYLPQAEGVITQGSVRSFTCRYSALPASVRLKDYDYARPTFEVSGQAPVTPSGVGQISVHGSRFFTPGEGAHLAQVKAQSLLVGQAVYQATGATPDMRPGYLFELEDHPRAAFNASYLTTELEHWANVMRGLPELEGILTWDDLHRVEATAIPAKVQFRAPQRTAWPRIYGGEHAVIDGPAVSDYAQIDSHGRYAVKFHFDESALTAGKASTWVRMLQPHGGGIEGFHFPLRVGTEVVCTFTGGDPDRPSIVGVAPNALTPSPVTSSNNTRNVIQTGGRNRLELEDKAGLERITMSTPNQNSYLRMGAPNDDHNLIVSTDGSMLIQSGTELDVIVGAAKTETVTGSVTETYDNTKSETVTGAVTEAYQSTKNETVTSTVTEAYNADVVQTIATTRNVTVGSDSTQLIKGKESHHVEGDGTLQYDSDYTLTVTGNYTANVTVDTHTTTTGNVSAVTLGSFSTAVQGAQNIEVTGAATTVVVGLALNNFLGGNITATEGLGIAGVYGLLVNVVGPQQFNLNFGICDATLFGTSVNTTVGGTFDSVEGFQLSMCTGASFEGSTLKALVHEINTHTAGIKLSTHDVALATQMLDLSVTDLSITT